MPAYRNVQHLRSPFMQCPQFIEMVSIYFCYRNCSIDARPVILFLAVLQLNSEPPCSQSLWGLQSRIHLAKWILELARQEFIVNCAQIYPFKLLDLNFQHCETEDYHVSIRQHLDIFTHRLAQVERGHFLLSASHTWEQVTVNKLCVKDHKTIF